jgi:methionine synthase I (cobalamin-dependent)
LKANVSQTAWANLSYTAPWTTQNFAAKYRKSTLGEVALTGEVHTNGTTYTGSNGLIGTLPVGFRPAQQVRYTLNCFNGSVRIMGLLTVNADGTVVFDGATGTAISSVNLDVVRFYTD